MSRKLWSVIAGLTAALTITGVAWASLPGAASREDGGAKIAASSKVSLNEAVEADSSTTNGSSTTVETEQESSTPTTTESSTPTTTESITSTTEGEHESSTSTTEGEHERGTSTTMADGNTSTTRHEDEHSSSDDQEQHTTTTAGTAQSLLDVVQTFQADGAGSVTVQVVAGVMAVSSVDPAPGWNAHVDDASSHEVEVVFSNGDQQVKLSVEIDGTLRAHVEHS